MQRLAGGRRNRVAEITLTKKASSDEVWLVGTTMVPRQASRHATRQAATGLDLWVKDRPICWRKDPMPGAASLTAKEEECESLRW